MIAAPDCGSLRHRINILYWDTVTQCSDACVTGITALGQSISLATLTAGNLVVNEPLSGSTVHLSSACTLNSDAALIIAASTGTTLASIGTFTRLISISVLAGF